MASDKPSDDDPESWYSTTWTVDQNRVTNEAFTSTYHGPVQTSTLCPTVTSLAHPPISPMPTPHFAHHTPMPGHPVPMDVDALHRKAAPEGSCFC